MSGERLLQRPRFVGVIQQGLLCGGLFPGVGTVLGLGLVLGSCKSQILGLHSLCIRSFSIIDGLWL